MENQLWNLFRETGDPMSYLLLKAEENSRTAERQAKEKTLPPAGETPTASV